MLPGLPQRAGAGPGAPREGTKRLTPPRSPGWLTQLTWNSFIITCRAHKQHPGNDKAGDQGIIRCTGESFEDANDDCDG